MNRWLSRSLSVVQLLLAAIVVVLLNLVTCQHSVTEDLTEDQKFSLSPRTTKFLGGELFSSRSEPIKCIAVINHKSPVRERVRKKLEEYKRKAACEIKIEFICPYLDKNRLLEVSESYKRQFYRDVLLVDARTAKEVNADVKRGRLSNLHIREFAVDSLYLTSDDGAKIDSWQDEDVITTNLLKAIEGKPRKFYFLVDKSEVDSEGKGISSWQQFRSNLNGQNLKMEEFRISSGEKIPEDAAGVAILGMQSDLDEQQVEILEEYWGRDSASIFITIDPTRKLKNIKRFLKSYGLAVENDRVLTTRNGRTFTNVRGRFTRLSKVTEGYGETGTQLDGASSSISIVNTDVLAQRNIHVNGVLQANPRWWGEVNYQAENPTYDRDRDFGSPEGNQRLELVNLACSVERGRINKDTTKHLTSKMLVVSNAQFLRPENMRDELNQFVDSSINWLVGREELIGVGSKKKRYMKITLNHDEKRQIDFVVIVLLPLIALIVAFILWKNRRS